MNEETGTHEILDVPDSDTFNETDFLTGSYDIINETMPDGKLGYSLKAER